MIICITTRSKVSLLLILFVAFLGVTKICSQEFSYFKHLTKEDGLSQSSVFAIAQDPNGFLWFGTRDGLNKFDGYKFKVYRKGSPDDGPIGNDIRSLYTDTFANKLWICTLEGVSFLDLSTYQFKAIKHDSDNPKSLPSDHTSAVLRDAENNLWIGTSKGLCLLNEESLEMEVFKVGETPIENTVNCLKNFGEKEVLVGTRGGLYILNINTKDLRAVDLGEYAEALNISSFVKETESSNWWIGTENYGLLKWDIRDDKFRNYRSNPKAIDALSNDNIRDLCFDQMGRLWIGTFNGLNLLDIESGTFQVFKNDRSVQTSITDNSIKSIYNDMQGGIWIGTYYGGVNHLDEEYNQFTNYTYSTDEKGLAAPVVSSFAEDAEGNLWIGTEGGGLDFYDRKKQSYNHIRLEDSEAGISGNNVKHLLLDDSYLWIGHYYNGLDRLNITTGEFMNINVQDGLSNNNVYDMLQIGSKLWLATYSGGLNIYDKDTGEITIFRNEQGDSTSLSSDFLRVLLQGKDGSIWIGGTKGINKVVLNDEGLPVAFEPFLEDRKIYALQEDRDGKIWLGTISNGLISFDPQNTHFEEFTVDDGLAGNTVFGILQDSKGFLWLSTNDGISRFDSNKKEFVNFNSSNGLSHSEFNYKAYSKAKNGDFLFGRTNGYTRFNPLSITINESIPEVVFTDILKNNVPMELDRNINDLQRLTFNYNEANFTIGFAALDYSNPKNNRFSYKLEGIDNDWITSIGRPQATYTIQRHGTYDFKLKGGNSSGYWNDNIRTLRIEVLPPPWRTWWAYLLYGLLVAGGFYAITRFLKLRYSYRYELKEKKQKEELHKLKLNFFTNVAHEFRTPLTLIIGPIEDLLKNISNISSKQLQKRLTKINENSQRMLNLVNQLMTFRKMESGHDKLNVVKVNLNEFIKKIYSLFEDHAAISEIKYELHLPDHEVEAYIDLEKIEKVLFNLLSNAFKFTPSDGNISLTLASVKDFIQISVEDSGVGISANLKEEIFKRFYEKNTVESVNLIKGTGIGLALSKELVELHSGHISVESEEGKGARFVMNIPKGKDHFAKESIIPTGRYRISHEPRNLTPVLEQAKSRKILTDTSLKMLIVDDNEEIRKYITSIFDGLYKILTAENGTIGLEKARTYSPDMVISDVMMPEMDGIEFCKALRSDIRTSHIPLILLTAKSMLEDKLDGLRSGANDFISKPFHPEELLMKVENLFNQQLKLRQTLTAQSFLPEEFDIPSADEAFLSNLRKLIDQNIDNPDFKIEQFSHELAVSRALLFTKIKALTDKTPKNFLKTFRMARAVQLLESGKMNIQEVAYHVGYKDPKYFSKVFQKEFGKRPTDYVTEFKV